MKNLILLVTIALTFSMSAEELPVIAHWSFDEDAGTTELKDSGPNKLNARLKSKAGDAKVQTDKGVKGQALKLEEEPKIKFIIKNKKGLLNLKVPYSISCWVKRTGKKPTSMSLFCRKSDSLKYGYDLRISWHMLDYRWGSENKNNTLRSPSHSVKDNKWMHVAVTNDGKKIKLYVNGEMQKETEGDIKQLQPQYSRKSAAVLGNYIGKDDVYNFIGLIDEFYIIGKALSEDEIFELATPSDK